MIQSFFNKYKEIIMYLIFGVLTTLISLGTYFLLTSTILNPNNGVELQITNVIAWIVSILFAFFTNKFFVFESKKSTLKELPMFFSLRIVTLLLDMLIMYLGVTVLLLNHKVIKLISEVIIVVSNYIFSKLIVFKK